MTKWKFWNANKQLKPLVLVVGLQSLMEVRQKKKWLDWLWLLWDLLCEKLSEQKKMSLETNLFEYKLLVCKIIFFLLNINVKTNVPPKSPFFWVTVLKIFWHYYLNYFQLKKFREVLTVAWMCVVCVSVITKKNKSKRPSPPLPPSFPCSLVPNDNWGG